MGAIKRAGACVAVGVLFGTGMNKLLDVGDMSLAEINRPYIECAGVLGETAVANAELPTECDSVSGAFPYRTVVVTEGEGGASYERSVTEATTYTLPPRKEFLDDNLTTVEEYRARQALQDRLWKYGAGAVSLACFGLFTLEDRKLKRYNARKESLAAEPVT